MMPAQEHRGGAPADSAVDWGMIAQRLAAHHRHRERIAVRFQLAVLTVAALGLAIAAPGFVYDVAIGLQHGHFGAGR